MVTIDYVEKQDETWVRFGVNTYKEVKSKMKYFLVDSIDNNVSVYRKRRGQWGEWFEHWSLDSNNRPIITKQGWQ